MAETSASLKLTHEGALAALNAGIVKATAMGQPQCKRGPSLGVVPQSGAGIR